MIISDTAINRSTTVFVFILLISVMGLFSYAVLPRESEPEVVVPFVRTVVTYQGVSPEDMESLVTVPIERKLTGISGVKEIESTSEEGVSFIVIEFETDIDIDDALQKVRDKVDQARGDLPEEADQPSVSEINIAELPIMFVSLTGDVGLAALTKVAEDLEDRIESIKGVLEVDLIGDVEREIQIEVDPDRVAEYGISLADLVTITRLENVNTPGGSMELGEAKFLMRVPGEFQTPDELTGLVVKEGPTGTVYLRDIAVVRDGFKDVDSYSRVNGKAAVTLSIRKRAGQNIIEITNAVKEVLNETRQKLPPGMEIAITMDESDDIREMVGDLENGILSGLILVVGVVVMFMGFANAIAVSLAIPISMLVTFVVFQICGTTLNMVTLFSLILALGMLVDNGIVVVENIYRHGSMGMTRIEAAKAGAAEVAWPVITSTLTTVVAFIPMFFWPGIWGKFMIYLPLTVCTALMASLFVGIVVNPALSSRTMNIRKSRYIGVEDPLDPSGKSVRKHHPFLEFYGSIVRLSVRWRAVTLVLSFTILVVIGYVFLSGAKVEFVPEVEPERAYIDIDCPEGTNLATSDEFVRYVEKVVEPYRPYLDNVVANVGSRGASEFGGEQSSSGNLSRVTLDFPRLQDCEILPSTIMENLRRDIGQVSGADIRFKESGMGPSDEPPINIEITGPDFQTLAKVAEQIKEHLKSVPGLVDLRDSYEKGKPEVKVIIDRQQAWKTGLNTQFIGLTVKAAVDGRKAGDYREGDEDYDVTVRFPKSFRENLENILDMNLINLEGKPIPFSSVAHIEQGAGLGSITRIDRKRTVTVSGEVEGDRRPPEVLANVRKAMETFSLPPGYMVAYTGENEEQEEAQTFLIKAFIVALLLIALVIVSQFNSLIQTFIIMTSVILSLAGVFLGLWLFDMPFGVVMVGIGCMSLAGVVVNNAIVLIDFTNKLRDGGMPVNEAVVQAGMIRFRPVMLTAIATILGLVPMAFGVSFDFKNFFLFLVQFIQNSVLHRGVTEPVGAWWVVNSASSQWWGSMSVAVIFGLGLATVLTLVVVPTLYSLTDSIENTLFRRKRIRKDVSAPDTLSVD